MRARIWPTPIAASTTAAFFATVFLPAAALAERWHDSFVFDACKQRALVEVERHGRKRAVPFERRRHAVKAGTPVSLTIRYPRLFASYQVLVEALEVPDALPVIRGTGQLPAIGLGEQPALPDTKGAQDIRTIDIARVTVESVLRGFLTRESATQLILQILTDRQKIVDGARTVVADIRELHEAVYPVLGGRSVGPPYDQVPSLTNAFRHLGKTLRSEAPDTDFCRLKETERHKLIAKADRRRQIREWVEHTARLIVNHGRVGERWRAVGADGLLDRVIRDAEDLDTRMNGFLDNLRAHDAALKLLQQLIDENGGARLSHTTLRDRWVLDFAVGLREEYSELREPEELRAIAERFERELARDDSPDGDSHVAWLEEFAHRLRRVVDESTSTVGTTVREICRECSGSTALTILRDAMEHLQKGIDRASTLGCCAERTPDLRSEVHTAAARVMDARSAIKRELSQLNKEAARLFGELNKILSHSRGSEIELPLGVYETNAVVTYRVFEQRAHERYALVPAAAVPPGAPEVFGVTSDGMVRADESGATLSDEPGEGFRFVGGSIFEVHRTYRLAAFGAFTWTSMKTREYKVRDGVPVEVGTSHGQLSYVFGTKVHPWERDLFPGSRNWWQPGLFFGVPVNRHPGILFGVSWGPYGGVELMFGGHWAKFQKLDKGIELGTQMTADSDGKFHLPVHESHCLRPFIGVSLDSNIFTSLFGTVAKIGGAF